MSDQAWALRRFRVGLSLLVLAVAAGCASRGSRPERIDPDLALETFHAAWTMIHDTHFDPDFNGVDWLALRQELEPRVREVGNEEELRAILRDMVGRLKQSHFALIPRSAVDAGDGWDETEEGDGGATPEEDALVGEGDGELGFEFRIREDRFLVTGVEEGGPAATAGIRPGWLLTAVGSNELDAWLERMSELDDGHGGIVLLHGLVASRLAGRAGSSAKLTFQDEDDDEVVLELVRTPVSGEQVQFGNLPPMLSRLRQREVSAHGVRVGVIHLSVWMGPLGRPFDEAVDAFRGLDGMVIDLRGNIGGVGAMVMGFAGHFLDERLSLGQMRTRTNTLEFRANPRLVSPAGVRVRPFDGPLAILIDELSASTSEIFAGGMQALGRARVFGAPSAGMALPAMMERLPNRDVLYHAIADFTRPGGRRLEGEGVVPDEEVPLRREDLLEGRDAVLDAALRWIASERGGG